MPVEYRSYIKYAERFYIETELRRGASVPNIARALNRDKSTIYAEIRRGSCVQIVSSRLTYREEVMVYCADHAEREAARRQSVKGKALKIGSDLELAEKIEKHINEDHWSPRTILGRLALKGELTVSLTPKTIYNYIRDHVLDVDEKNLPFHGIQKKAAAKRARRKKGPTRGKPIDLRPSNVLDRIQFGHWEGDLVVGKQGSRTVVMTLVERKTRFCITMELPNRKSATIVAALDKLEKKAGRWWYSIFKTITFDNGVEFADSDGLERSRYKKYRSSDGAGGRCVVYYAHPYSSFERGSNENCNGLLRRGGIKKGANIALLPKGTVAKATAWVNDMPRSILGFKTAREAFYEEIELLHVCTMA